MAKKDLDSILGKIKTRIEQTDSLRNELDKRVHEYSISADSVYTEIVHQLSDLIDTVDSPSSVEVARRKEVIKRLSKEYVAYMYGAFKSKRSSARTTRYVFSKGSNKEFFTVSISSPSNLNTNVFAIIRDVRRDSSRGLPYVRKTILDEVFNNTEDMVVDKALYGGIDPKTGQRSGGLLQVGHDKGGSVSIRRKAQLLKEFQFKNNIDKLLVGTATSKELRAEIQLAVSTFATGSYNNLKEFSVSIQVTEESSFRNQRDSAKEKAFLNALSREVKATLKEKVDFFNQRGSPSALEIVRNKLINTAIKAGAKGRAKPLKNSKSKGSAKIYQKTTKSRSKETINAKTPKISRESGEVDSSNRNWLQLLPLINAKLTDQVMQNMKAPRLVNRTGRFAQSAKVINVEQTRQGFPSFVFDYERDPYDVFDRTLGRAPWNTPQRDPRALVDTSVREIVREMAIGRFFTRRA